MRGPLQPAARAAHLRLPPVQHQALPVRLRRGHAPGPARGRLQPDHQGGRALSRLTQLVPGRMLPRRADLRARTRRRGRGRRGRAVPGPGHHDGTQLLPPGLEREGPQRDRPRPTGHRDPLRPARPVPRRALLHPVRPTMTYSGPTDLYIAGTWRPAATGARFTVTDPATGAAIADVADADVTDARAATDAAEKTLPDWARRPPRERAEVLRHVFEAMTTQRDELAELI